VTLSAVFNPTAVGTVTGVGTLQSEDPTPTQFNLIGEGLPDDPPVLGACAITPSTAFLGQAPIFTLEVSDTATLSNVSTCRAFGVSGFRQVLINLVDDASVIGDVSCDGIFTGFSFTGGLFGVGTWDFTYQCVDKQLNLNTSTPTCQLIVQ